MQFDLIEALSLAGDSNVANDDRAGACGASAWVIDGSSDLGPPGLVGTRGGAAWLAMEADRAFAGAADAPLAAICTGVFDRLAERYAECRTRDAVARWELPSAAFLAVRIAGDAIDCAWLGDCAGLLRHGDTTVRLGEAAAGRAAESAHAASLAAHGLGTARSAPVLDSLRRQRDRPERKVLGVERAVAAVVRHARFDCAIGDDLLLMSDGFAALSDVYGLYDEAGMLAALATTGLAGLATRLRDVERDDAAALRFPRFKPSDDATALWLRVAR